MINHYTANRKVRNDDAYSPGGQIGLRPDRATMPYCQRAREAFPGVPVIAGGVEARLRRLAHYDYWSDTVRRAIMLDAKADLVVFGMGEQQIVKIAKPARGRRDGQGPARYARRRLRAWAPASRSRRRPTRSFFPRSKRSRPTSTSSPGRPRSSIKRPTRSTPRRLVQYHDRQAVVCNPPPLPITQDEMDRVYGLPYTRKPHPMYRGRRSRPTRSSRTR